MAALSIGSHLSSSREPRRRAFSYPPPVSLPSIQSFPSSRSSLCKIRGPRLLRHGILARAENEAKGSSSPLPSRQSTNEKQLQVEIFIIIFFATFNSEEHSLFLLLLSLIYLRVYFICMRLKNSIFFPELFLKENCEVSIFRSTPIPSSWKCEIWIWLWVAVSECISFGSSLILLSLKILCLGDYLHYWLVINCVPIFGGIRTLGFLCLTFWIVWNSFCR